MKSHPQKTRRAMSALQHVKLAIRAKFYNQFREVRNLVDDSGELMRNAVRHCVSFLALTVAAAGGASGRLPPIVLPLMFLVFGPLLSLWYRLYPGKLLQKPTRAVYPGKLLQKPTRAGTALDFSLGATGSRNSTKMIIKQVQQLIFSTQETSTTIR